MDDAQKKIRKQRINAINKALEKIFPEARIALDYGNVWELLLAVILSAQCTDIRVNKVTKPLFRKYKKLSDYVSADLLEFQQDIRSTGFFRNKAKNILASAKMVEEDFGGKVPDSMEELLKLPGVARKTANVVLSNAFGKEEGIAVDTHVRRFVIRFDLSDFKDPVRIEKDLMDLLPTSEWNKITYRLIEYGREICPARAHECSDHPATKIFPEATNVWPKAK